MVEGFPQQTSRKGGGAINDFLLYSDLISHEHTQTHTKTHTCISLPIGTNGKPVATVGKFPSAIGKFMIGKMLATNGEEITNAMIGNDVLANYW